MILVALAGLTVEASIAAAPKTAQGTANDSGPQISAYIVLLAAPLIAFSGVLAGQLLPEYFGRRRVIRDRYDLAISAVTQLQAARHGAGLDVPSHLLKAVDDKAAAEAVQELSTDGVKRYLNAAAASRAALAALHVYSPDLREYWDKFEVAEAELDPLVATLFDRREHPLKQHA